MSELQTRDARLAAFLAAVAAPECLDACIARTGADRDDIAERIRQYSGEVPITLALLEGIPLDGRRILDVGAGIGLTSLFLRREGFDVTALEPGGIGFEINHDLFLALRDSLDCGDVPLHSIGAEALDPGRHGRFDVMFSANVLEHVADLEAVVSAMARSLAPGGVMVHTCPNYTVPYEPHYRLPLLPLVPAATPWAGSRKAEGLWQSFNFVTVGEMDRLLRGSGLRPVFAKGIMAKAFERLLVDPVFATRHSPGLARLARILQATGALALLRALPPRLATPMIVMATKGSG